MLTWAYKIVKDLWVSCQVPHGALAKTLSPWQRGIRVRFDTKGMTTEGDVNGASTTNVRMDGGKNNWKGKKHQKGNEEVLHEPTPTKALTSHPPSTIKASDDELGEDAIDVTAGE